MYRQEYGSYPNSYATYAHPRRRKLDSRGVSSRGTGESDLGDQPLFHVKFLGSQLMGKEEPNPELVLDLISSLVENLRDDNFRPRSYTVQVTDSEVIICETAAEWTERVPLRVIHYCMQGDNPNSRAFGFVASARQGFMGHVFLARNTAEAKELKKTFYYGFERAFQKYKDKQEDQPRVRQQPQVKRAPFVDRPYSAPSYNAYYRYYPTSRYPPQAGAPPRYRVSAQPGEARYAAGQPLGTRYYANREQEAAQRQQQQYYRRSRPTDSFLHEYQYGVGSQDHHYPESRVRQSRSVAENGYHPTAERRGRNYRSQTPEPPPRESRRRHVVSDDMIF